MADNKTFQSATPATVPAGTIAATKQVAFSGDTSDVQLIEVVAVTGAEGSRTLNEISDASGLKIQDGGNSITVDGTVAVTGVATAANQTTQTTALDAIKTAVETIDNFISGSKGLVTEDNSAAALTALQLIDDTVAVLGTATYTEATTKGTVIGAIRRDADTTLVDTTNEVSPLQVDANGRLKVEAFSGETLPVSLTSTTVTGTVAVTQSGTWDEVGINDSGNSITVDAPVGTPAFVRLSDGSAAISTLPVSAASLPLPSLAATSTKQSDGSQKTQVVSSGGTVAAFAPSVALEVDTLAVVVPDSITITGTVNVQEAGALIDDTSFTVAGSKVFPMGAMADEVTPDSVSEGDIGVPRMSLNRNLLMNIRDNAGNERGLNVDANGEIGIGAIRSAVTVNAHAVTNAGTFATQVDGAALTALQLIDDSIKVDDAAFTPATSSVSMAGFEADETATDSVDEGDAGAARMTLDRKQIVTVQPHTSGGLATFMASGSDGSSILVATAQAIKASAGQMYGYYAYNPEAAVTFVHFYNTAAASVTVGTTNPLFTIAIPAGSAANLMGANGITFSNAGWSCAATTTAGGNTAPATGVSLVVWYM